MKQSNQTAAVEGVKVDKMWWNKADVQAFSTEAAFLGHYMPMEHIYPRREEGGKERSLRTVYAACVPAKAEPAPVAEVKEEKQSKPPAKKIVATPEGEA